MHARAAAGVIKLETRGCILYHRIVAEPVSEKFMANIADCERMSVDMGEELKAWVWLWCVGMGINVRVGVVACAGGSH